MAIGLREGRTIEGLHAELDTLPQGDLLRLETATLVGEESRHAVGTQAPGLWLVAGVGAVATVAVQGAAVSGVVRTGP
jgi:hypothetical protein